MDTKELLEWAEFVATKFESSRTGWVYSRELNGLKHIRYEHDYTGNNHWVKRVKRAFNLKRFNQRFSRRRGRKLSPKGLLQHYSMWAMARLRKHDNLPDGQINGNFINWEEDGEYIAIFQPRVGVKVIEFLRAEPENPYAKAILAEMEACVELSWAEASTPDESR